MASLFFSYSHVDEQLRNQLGKHLVALQRSGEIQSWHDRRIVAGSDFASEIDQNLLTADVILLLLSTDFIASDYCMNREMTLAIERVEKGEAQLVPVILRPCDWKELPIAKFLATPKDGRPVTKWPDTDDAFLDVVESIKKLIRSTGSRVSKPPSTARDRFASQPVLDKSRSSNLQIRKRFTNYDEDAFRNNGFEYIRNFFESTVVELLKRESTLQAKVRPINEETFTAAIYQHGEKKCQCTIRIGRSFGNGIEFTSSDDPSDHSITEHVSVEADDQKLYFKALDMQSRLTGKSKLSFDGAAELFWELFFDPISAK